MLKVVAERQPSNKSRIKPLDLRASVGKWNEVDLAVKWKAEVG